MYATMCCCMSGCQICCRKSWTLILAIFENLCFAGCIYGWPSLQHVLQDGGYFDTCSNNGNLTDQMVENEPKTCQYQDSSFSLIFTMAAFAVSLSTLPNGFIYDKAGTRVSKICASILFLGAFLLFIFSTPEMPFLLYPAMILWAIGGCMLLVTNFQVANLFAAKRSTVITLLSAAFDSSAVIMMAINFGYRFGVSLQMMFIGYVCVSLLLNVNTFFLLPKSHIPYPLPDDYFYKTSSKLMEEIGLRPIDSPKGGLPNGSANRLHGYYEAYHDKMKVLKRNQVGVAPECNGETECTCRSGTTQCFELADRPAGSQDMETANKLANSQAVETEKRPAGSEDVTVESDNKPAGCQATGTADNQVIGPKTKSAGSEEITVESENKPAGSQATGISSRPAGSQATGKVNQQDGSQTSATDTLQAGSQATGTNSQKDSTCSQATATDSQQTDSQKTASNTSQAIGIDKRPVPSQNEVLDSQTHLSLSSQRPSKNDEYEVNHDSIDSGLAVSTYHANQDINSENNNPKAIPSVKQCVLSGLFVSHLIWMSILQHRNWFYLGTFQPWITVMADNDEDMSMTTEEKESHYTTVFAFIQLGAIFFGPLCGLIVDRNKKSTSESGWKRVSWEVSTVQGPYADLYDTVLALLVTCTLSVLFSIAIVVPMLQVQYVSFVLQVILRSFLYGLNAAFIAIAFPVEHLGTLLGVDLALAAVFGLIQFPLFKLAQSIFEGDPFWINVGLLALNFVTYAHPIYVAYYCKRETLRMRTEEVDRRRRNREAEELKIVNIISTV